MILNTVDFILRHPLSGRTPVRSLARYIAWQISSRMTKVHVHPWIGGTRLIVERGMAGATGNIYTGLHEFADMAFVLHFLGRGDTFLDVGANIGSYTILASGVRGARTIAFEPVAATARHFLRNIEANELQNLVTLHQVALGAHQGDISFTSGLDSMNRVARTGDPDVMTVEMWRLDDVAGAEKASLMKVDVEGYEHELFKGATAVLGSRNLLAVETENSDPAVVSLLHRFGFARVWYDPFHRRLLDEPAGYPAANALFIRNRDEVLKRVSAAPAVSVLGLKI